MFRHGVLFKSSDAKLSADTGLFEATPFGLGEVWVVVVNPDRAVTHFARYTVSHAGIRGPYGACQPIIGVVGDGDGFCFGGECFYGDDRTETFFDDSRIIGCALI